MYNNRISTAARYNLLTADIQRNEANFNRITQQLASGKKVASITDDPIAAVNIVNTNRQLGQIETFNQNVNMGMEELDNLDDLMTLAEGYLTQAWDKATQANSQTYGVPSLKALKTEIDELTKTMVDLANTEFNGNFVFGGANTQITPYTINEETGEIVYNGTTYDNSDYVRTTEVADGVFEVLNTTGDKVFGYYRAGDDSANVFTAPNGKKVIKTTENNEDIYRYENGNLYRTGLSADGLEPVEGKPDTYTDSAGRIVLKKTDDSGNITYEYEGGGLYGNGKDSTGLTAGYKEQAEGVFGALQLLSNSLKEVIAAKEAGDTTAEKAGYEKMFSTLDMFSKSHNDMVTEQTKFGGVHNRLEMTQSTLETNNENLTSYLSQLQDVDIAAAVSQWYQAQYAYQASLQVAAQSMNMSLLNYL